MEIVVSATALRSSGALTIYMQFLKHLQNHANGNVYHIFIDKNMPQPSIANVEYIPVDTHSVIKRIQFDNSGCAQILSAKEIRADVAISLQNTCVKLPYKCKHILYYHQSIPLYPNKWNPLKRNERTLFFYKHVYPFFVKKSLSRDTKVVVQIPYIKHRFCKFYDFPAENVYVMFPDIEDSDTGSVTPYKWEDNKKHFIYPATAISYKNHITIVRAILKIKEYSPKSLDFIKIHFTINKEDIPKLHNVIIKNNIGQCFDFMGVVEYKKLLSIYKNCAALLYPSTIETLGLPLIEAASFGRKIIVSDMEYAHEVLGDYNGSEYIPTYDSDAWSQAIINVVSDDICRYTPLTNNNNSSWNNFFELINQ